MAASAPSVVLRAVLLVVEPALDTTVEAVLARLVAGAAMLEAVLPPELMLAPTLTAGLPTLPTTFDTVPAAVPAVLETVVDAVEPADAAVAVTVEATGAAVVVTVPTTVEAVPELGVAGAGVGAAGAEAPP
jgi:hypothetical protein